MNYDTPASSLARIIYGATLVLAFLYLPGIWLWLLAFLGAIFFPFYLEGIILFFVYQVMAAAPATWFSPFTFLGTVTLLVTLKLGVFIRDRLFWQA